ncbi:MAG: SAM-dependent chlorinase/fluorinase [Bradymonadaceae bacterium]|nr:SAM-dependent chlorinase/fluorinase [Lujinxingiaceae bacterium]
MAKVPMIGLLTDFGIDDAYVGILKCVILDICPAVPVVDLCHAIAGQNILSGAYLLGTTASYLPHGAVVVAVVDPGVGTARRAVAVRTERGILVGPDNGLFSFVLRHHPAHEVFELTNAAYHLEAVSATFHGRDIFAPVAAHLACGIEIEAIGTRCSSDSLVYLANTDPIFHDEEIEANVIHIDRFGNVITNLTFAAYRAWEGDVATKATIELEEYEEDVPIYRSFGEVPVRAPLAFWGSGGHLELAVREGSAASVFGLGQESSLVVKKRSS